MNFALQMGGCNISQYDVQLEEGLQAEELQQQRSEAARGRRIGEKLDRPMPAIWERIKEDVPIQVGADPFILTTIYSHSPCLQPLLVLPLNNNISYGFLST